ncbi:zf-HC2 domain-containing protein [Massilia sp. ST3]|uniref:zf-HC2 domain-containing protein n=1 Tax=Massilia sp. ST3 TaxID=2824903 RepID=UPI001B843C0F|nr:zf-HC2 domain-containing protein [Massilia sp. ST3]MBQ5946476.1 zf-HC2 domain-containing protein [Massilia sp. ST3]
MNPHAGMATQDAHRAAQEALPWLLNGTLAGAERSAVERHLDACAQCRAELDALRGLRAAARQPDPDCDPERALARLLPALDAAPPAPPRVTLLERWRQMLAANDARWLGRLAAAQFAVIALLGGLLLTQPSPDDSYRLLGAETPRQASLVLVFQPDMPERELRRIARASGVRIVGGPTAADGYLAAVPDGALAPALARLRAEPAVLLAEPLAEPPEGGRQP